MTSDQRRARPMLNAVLAQRAVEQPDRPFVEIIDGPSLSYAELDVLCRRWASGLRQLGVGEGDRVVTMLAPGVDAYAAWLGLSWLRAIDTGVNTEYRGQMLAYILNNSGAKVAIVQSNWLDRLLEVLPEAPAIQKIIVSQPRGPVAALPAAGLPVEALSVADLLDGVDAVPADNPPRARDMCSVTYTSGTTGASKGVLFPWGLMDASARGSIPIDELGPEDAFYSPFPMHHGSGRFPLALMALCGGRVVVRDRFSGTQFWEDVRKYGCTMSAFVGAMSAFLWNQPPADDDADNPLRMALMFPVVPQHREFQDRFALRIRTLYSMTETGPIIASGWSPEESTSCGRVNPGYEIRLVDEDDYEVPEGTIGEVIVRADEPWVLNAGYLDLPDATAKAWRNGWFHTGDAMRSDKDGNYYFVDRIKDAIRRRGENISSFEVEAHVNTHPDVLESAAVAVPSEWGEDEVKVVVVRRPGSELTPPALVLFLAEVMPRFMVPRYVEFTDELPKTEATLRVRKVELRTAGVTERTWDREAAGMKLAL